MRNNKIQRNCIEDTQVCMCKSGKSAKKCARHSRARAFSLKIRETLSGGASVLASYRSLLVLSVPQSLPPSAFPYPRTPVEPIRAAGALRDARSTQTRNQ